MAQFIAYLQHNGFPTPLLDWTYSPYIAAYFAFENVNHFSPSSDDVAIYSFNQEAWATTYKQTYNFEEKNQHVTILRPLFSKNHKQMLQQGIFLFTNSTNPEQHILLNEKDKLHFLTKYIISVKERQIIMKDLELMGITAMQLYPSIESVCKTSFESLCTRLTVGKTPSELKNNNVFDIKAIENRIKENHKNKTTIDYIKCPEYEVLLNPKNLKKHLLKQHGIKKDTSG